MRIDTLPANAHPNRDSGTVKADLDPNQNPGPFFELIGGMAASAAPRADKSEDFAEPEEEENRARRTDASTGLPYALVSAHSVRGEVQAHELELSKAAGATGGAQTVSAPQLDSREPAPGGADKPSPVCQTPASAGGGETQESATLSPVKPEDPSRIASVAASVPVPEMTADASPDLLSGHEGETDPAAKLSILVSQVHSRVDRKTGETGGGGETAYFQTVGQDDLKADAQRTEMSAPFHPASQGESALPSSNLLRAGVGNSPTVPPDAAAVAAMAPAEVADAAQIPGELVPGTPLREAPTDTMKSIIDAGLQETAIAAGMPGVLTGSNGSVITKGQGAKETSTFPEIRDHARKSRALITGENIAGQAEDPQTAALLSRNARQPILGADALTDIVGDGQPGSHDTAIVGNKAVPSRRAMESSAESPAGAVETADFAWAGMQSAQRLLFQNQAARMNTSEASAASAFRPTQHSVSTTAAFIGDGLQAGYAAGTDIKSLMALLAPRQSTPAQSADFLTLLADRIQAQIRENQNILTIQLKPSALGRMEIKAETSAAGVLATITTESTKIKDFIEQNLPSLQQSFQDQGIKVDRISVTVQDGSLHQSTAGRQESHANPSGNSGFDTHSRISDDFELAAEELALDQQTLLALNPHSTFHAIA